jgi:2-octaprenyl-6-methoxyphenol hydroxylase
MTNLTAIDAVVVGGGLVGQAAAIALARSGLSVVHCAPPAPPDRRTSALMMPSVDWLASAGLVVDPTAVGHRLGRIRIIDMTGRLVRAPETLFDSGEAGLPAFGCNFANIALAASFQSALAGVESLVTRPVGVVSMARRGGVWQLTLADDSVLSAPLVVGADGKRSLVRASGGFATRERALGESALVADVQLARPIGDCSVEFHYPRGPFTLVPAGAERANLVWIDDPDVLAEARSATPEALAKILRERSLGLFGAVTPVSGSAVFPLSLLSVTEAGRDGLALVGEAAHAFPPIGAQGLNLGLRDVADLLAAIAATERGNADWPNAVSRDYAGRRAGDLTRTGAMVEALYGSLVAGMLPAQALRAGGLWALRSLPGLRRTAFAVGMGER